MSLADHQPELESMEKLADDLNAGLPLPAVHREDLKSMCQAIKSLGLTHWQTKAIGRGAITAAGGPALLNGAETMAVMVRANLVESLHSRGVLSEFENGGEPSDAIFQVAATIEVNTEDLGEIFLLAGLRDKSAEEIAKAKQEWLVEGYDPEHPRIDPRFVAAVRESLRSIDRDNA